MLVLSQVALNHNLPNRLSPCKSQWIRLPFKRVALRLTSAAKEREIVQRHGQAVNQKKKEKKFSRPQL